MRSLARADRDARFPAHEKQRRFKNRSVLVFAVRVARVPPARVNSLSIFSSTPRLFVSVARFRFFLAWKKLTFRRLVSTFSSERVAYDD